MNAGAGEMFNNGRMSSSPPHTEKESEEITVEFFFVMAAWRSMNITSPTQSSFLFIHLSAKCLFLIAASKPSVIWKNTMLNGNAGVFSTIEHNRIT